MSTDPERAEDLGRDDPLVERLRELQWPSVDDQTRERALERFRELVRQREQGDGAA